MKTVQLLLSIYIDSLWFGSHHFPEFILIEANEVDSLLNKIDFLVKRYENKISNLKNVLEEFSYYEDLYKSWFKYKKEDSSNITFSQWCKNNKKNYFFAKSFYYQKKIAGEH